MKTSQQAKHWTPKSGFFPCTAKNGCPKQSEHFSTVNKSSEELTSVYVEREKTALNSLMAGEITQNQYKKAVSQVRKETVQASKNLQKKPSTAPFSVARRGMVAAAGAAVLVGSLTACGTTVAELPDKTSNVSDSQATVQTLNDAEKINVNKSLVSLGDNWSVKVGDNEVATVKGQFIAVLGDTYSMYSPNENLVASEAEQVVLGLPAATMYDYNNEEQGVIKQELSPFMQKYTIKNIAGETVGTAEQQFSLGLKFDIKDASGETEYTVSKAMISWGASLDIEKKVDQADVSAEQALWVTMIANELNEEKSDSSKKNDITDKTSGSRSSNFSTNK